MKIYFSTFLHIQFIRLSAHSRMDDTVIDDFNIIRIKSTVFFYYHRIISVLSIGKKHALEVH